MSNTQRLLCIFAHPDDEAMGMGATLSKYAASGTATYLVTATRGQRGWQADPSTNPGEVALGAIREEELKAACQILGLHEVHVLDYMDGELAEADTAQITAELVAHIRRLRPQVVVTFGSDGVYGHPDHIAISQYTSGALIQAAASDYRPDLGPPHSVSKLYWLVTSQSQLDIYQQQYGDIQMMIDGAMRRGVAWPDWAITTTIDTADFWHQAAHAIACHQTQIPSAEMFTAVDEQLARQVWAIENYYLVYSLVHQGRQVETDLFAGLV